ncbi:hypothetical protein [Arenivirga flava]|uniref:Uncharacterized protein n=1 Tax=Arenivirga flava TaxID=1930060 RepID=A0AA37XBX5_9MICO|nr:hypothetical protein [Arenivirga flava]GMA28905.1 hypothetical protein GCM10025874_21580 [Arenivirga flava]
MSDAEGEWVALPRLRFWGRFLSLHGDSVASLLLVASPLILQLVLWGIRAVTEPSLWTTLLIALLGATFFSSILAAFLVQPTVRIRSDGGAWRVRRRVHSPEEIDRAVQHARDDHDQLWLALGDRRRIRFSVPVPTRAEPQLDARQLAAVIALVERAPIELPPPKQDPWDPKGRFAHLDRQGFLDAADAAQLLRDPPATGFAPNADSRPKPRKGGVDRYPWSA